jgi:oxygen-dependent protoporphyrinogen oxidase
MITMNEQAKDVVVVGGGISGLTAAWHLNSAGLDVALLEAGRQVGGCMRTEHRDGFLLEKGPFNVIVRDPAFEELLSGLSDELQVIAADKAARSRYLYRKGRLQRVPTNPVSFLTSGLLSFGARCRALAGLVASPRPTSEECTIEDFAARRFGREVADTMVSALIAGILAGDIRKLSINACFPSVGEFDQRARSPIGYGLGKALAARRAKGDRPRRRWRGLVSIDRGLGAICETLGKRLGGNLFTGFRVEALHLGEEGYTLSAGEGAADYLFRCRHLVLAVPAAEAARLLEPVAPEAGEIISTIESASVAVVNMAFRRQDVGHPMRGFGFLVPHNEPDFPLMGVLWADSAFPHHGKPDHRLIRVFIGGARTPDVMSRSTDELVATACEALRDLLGIKGDPVLVDACPCRAALPQYYLGHLDKIRRLRERTASFPGLHLAGNYLEGVSINDCVRLGRRVAREIIRRAPHENNRPVQHAGL